MTEHDIHKLANVKIKEHHIHSSYDKSLIEKTIQYIKDRTKSFDDGFSCKKNKYELKHVQNWLNPYIGQHNKEITYCMKES